ncbi:MAG: hypothetical protein RBR53_05700 [Desulforegulaceae bacterium]|nr:hypothetical protein [Desulforegulaceae bacterium]
MKLKYFFIFVLVFVFFSGCSWKTNSFRTDEVFKKEFLITDNQPLNLCVKKDSHVLLKNSDFSVEYLSPFVVSSIDSQCVPEIIWVFKIKSFYGFYPKKVQISEVNYGCFKKPLIIDQNLVFKKRLINLRTNGTLAVSDTNKWLFNNKDEFLVFKIEMFENKNKSSLLYQPFFLSLEEKKRYLRAVTKIKSNKNCP